MTYSGWEGAKERLGYPSSLQIPYEKWGAVWSYDEQSFQTIADIFFVTMKHIEELGFWMILDYGCSQSGLGASDNPKCSHAAAKKGERNLLGFKFLCHRSPAQMGLGHGPLK